VLDGYKTTLHFIQGYGLTETSPVTHIMRSDDGNLHKNNSIGTVLPGQSAKICDPETGEALPEFKEGELYVKGPNV